MKLAVLALVPNLVSPMVTPVLLRGAKRMNSSVLALTSQKTYGSPKCPCVGIDNVPGEKDIAYENTTVSYPADAGAHCDSWEKQVNPECTVDDPPAWCSHQWCYVNPCDCDLPVPPKPSDFLPEASYQGMQLFYSYATCGGTDDWTKEKSKDSCTNHDTEEKCTEGQGCDWYEGKCVSMIISKVCKPYNERGPPEDMFGLKDCPCVGVAGVPGSFRVKEKGSDTTYPADVGSKCEAWQTETSQCKEDSEEAECVNKWCYVDPCNCKLPEHFVPRRSQLLDGAVVHGLPVYYSYETCGESDTHREGCITAENEAACTEMDRCVWEKGHCIDSELPSLCEKFEAAEGQLRPIYELANETNASKEKDDWNTTTTTLDPYKQTAAEVKAYREWSR